MYSKKFRNLVPLLFVAGFLTLASAPADAFSFTLETSRVTLTNVDDPAGRWQHEGGDILRDGRKIGHYVITRRVTFGGTDQQNAASVSMTLFFLNSGSAPQNLTLHGAHSFTSGNYIGSVSAASSALLGLVGAHFVGDSGTGDLVFTL